MVMSSWTRVRSRGSVALSALATLGSFAAPVAGQCSYEVLAVIEGAPCGFGGTVPINLFGLNDDLLVVGREGACPDLVGRPVYWSPETGLVRPEPPVLGDLYNAFYDVNASGLMVGTFDFDGPLSLGVVYDGTAWTFLSSSPDGGECTVRYVNDAGVVAGHRDVEVEPGVTIRAAFRWTAAGGYEDLVGDPLAGRRTVTGLAPDGTVLGYEGFQTGDKVPFLWHPDGSVTMPETPQPGEDGRLSIGRLNALGEYGVGVRDADGQWDVGLMTVAGFLRLDVAKEEEQYASHVSIFALAANGMAGGRPVYTDLPSPFFRSGWISHRYGRTVRIRELVVETERPVLGGPAFMGPTAVLPEVRDISPNGDIVAWGDLPSGTVGVVLRPVSPRPGDLTGDCRVTLADVLRILERWGQTPVFADPDDDGRVGFGDLLVLLAHWG